MASSAARRAPMAAPSTDTKGPGAYEGSPARSGKQVWLKIAFPLKTSMKSQEEFGALRFLAAKLIDADAQDRKQMFASCSS
mmetsp:Transcript_8341/g.14610  ORF Transcript_8341/g.14610 Transcript_8341/m.14610 type:complete len:81 (+) Transcript_8341:2-244(+)